MEERRRGQKRLRRKRAHSEVDGEQERNETGMCCQELDFSGPCGFLPVQNSLGLCDPREVQVTATPKLSVQKLNIQIKQQPSPARSCWSA